MLSRIIFLLPILLLFLLVVIFNHKNKVLGVNTSETKEKTVRGIILPHHDLTSSIIEESLVKLSKSNNYSRIVIFSPNHFHSESYTFTTTSQLRNFVVDGETVKKIIGFDPNISIDQFLIENEHGITVPAAFLTKYFPEAQIIPLAVSPHFKLETLQNMARFLAQLLPGDTLFVASSDFAHNQMYLPAMENNRETIESVKNFEIEKMVKFQDDHLDSPASVITLLYLMQNLKTAAWETWFDTHGAILTGNPALQGTSYVIGVFR